MIMLRRTLVTVRRLTMNYIILMTVNLLTMDLTTAVGGQFLMLLMMGKFRIDSSISKNAYNMQSLNLNYAEFEHEYEEEF